MIGILLLSLLLLKCASGAALAPVSEQVTYDGVKVCRVEIRGDFRTVQDKFAGMKVQTWNNDVAQHMDVAVAPTDIDRFEALGLQTSVMHEDLGADIAVEWNGERWTGLSKRGVPDFSWFSSYHSYDDHIKFISNLTKVLPNNSELISSGKSVEGRAITGLHIWGSSGKGSKEAVIIHGTVHAREWITTMVVEYFAYRLMTGYGQNSNATKLLADYDFYILPVVNPDGFVYSQTTNRLWRKNRSAAPPGSDCLGTDINRNWPYQWDAASGSSAEPCAETYRGQSAGDSPEVKGLIALAQNLKETTGIKLYLDVHSYGQYILTPYGYSCDAIATNQQKHEALAANTANVIHAFSGTNWTTGPTCSTLYATSGLSIDYMADIGNAELSLVFELRNGDSYNWLLPPAQILPSGQEMWEGWKYLMLNM